MSSRPRPGRPRHGLKGLTVSYLDDDARPGGPRRPYGALAAALGLSTILLSGCMGAPTYGTGTPADAQLASDVSSIFQFGPDEEEKAIAYNPRPGLVMPSSASELPPPQMPTASADNPDWPESPEERRARIRAEATANRDDPDYEPAVEADTASGSRERSGARQRWNELPTEMDRGEDTRERFNERLARNNQGSPSQRRYLSEPPLDYRQPADSAPAGDIGDDEWRKERDAKRAARRNMPARARENTSLF